MKGNFLQCTHNGTGGTGDLTLAAVDAFLTLGAPLGANIRQVYYKIVEYDGDPSTGRRNFVKSESGWCPLDNTGGSPILKRSDGTIVVLTSNDGTNSYPKAGSSTAPSKQSFGNTAANIRISYSAGAEDNPLINPAITATSGVTYGLGRSNVLTGTINALTSTVLTNQLLAYFPVLWGDFGLYTQITLNLQVAFSGATTSSLRVGIYEVAKNGDPGKLLADFGNLGVLTAAGALTSSALGTAIFLDPGWYYLGILEQYTGTTGSASLSAMGAFSGTPLGFPISGANSTNMYASSVAAQTVLTDPAVAPTGRLLAVAGIAPLFGLK